MADTAPAAKEFCPHVIHRSETYPSAISYYKQCFLLTPIKPCSGGLHPMKRLVFFSLLLLTLASFSLAQAAKPAPAAGGPGYHLLNSYPIGGDGGWDYLTVEPTQRRLYVSRGNRAIVF